MPCWPASDNSPTQRVAAAGGGSPLGPMGLRSSLLHISGSRTVCSLRVIQNEGGSPEAVNDGTGSRLSPARPGTADGCMVAPLCYPLLLRTTAAQQRCAGQHTHTLRTQPGVHGGVPPKLYARFARSHMRRAPGESPGWTRSHLPTPLNADLPLRDHFLPLRLLPANNRDAPQPCCHAW